LDTKELVSKWKDKLPVNHIWHEDIGFRKNQILNLSLYHSKGDYVIFLDGDCIPHKMFVYDHIKNAERGFFIQGRRAFISEKSVSSFLNNNKGILHYILTLKVSGVLKAIRTPIPIIRINRQQRGLIGCNLSAWKKDLIAVNGFDTSYTGWGIGEDSDICTRLYNLGLYRKFMYGNAIVYHLNHPVADKSHHQQSLKKLDAVIKNKTVRCEQGFDQCFKGGGS
jgi:cellulose synthase/poly-beta-1,6-N-acetylglucosamine synthase-like glycosyltransferase